MLARCADAELALTHAKHRSRFAHVVASARLQNDRRRATLVLAAAGRRLRFCVRAKRCARAATPTSSRPFAPSPRTRRRTANPGTASRQCDAAFFSSPLCVAVAVPASAGASETFSFSFSFSFSSRAASAAVTGTTPSANHHGSSFPLSVRDELAVSCHSTRSLLSKRPPQRGAIAVFAARPTLGHRSTRALLDAHTHTHTRTHTHERESREREREPRARAREPRRLTKCARSALLMRALGQSALAGRAARTSKHGHVWQRSASTSSVDGVTTWLFFL